MAEEPAILVWSCTERDDEDRHSLLRQLRLRAEGPRCEGATAKTWQYRHRARPLERRRVRDFRRRQAEIFQAGTRTLPDRRGDRRAVEEPSV